MKIAAIDIGSNSVHMIIAATSGEGSFQVIDREKEMVFLGRSVFERARLDEQAFAAGIAVIERYMKLAQRHGCDEILAVATAATREAENGGDFLYAITEATGIHPQVITGTEEARLIYLAVRHGIDLSDRSMLNFDVGGGSVEVVVGDARKLRSARSMKLGVQRLRAAFGGGGPLHKRDRRELEHHVKELAQPVIREARQIGYDFVVGTSGTILALGAAAHRASGAEPFGSITGHRISLAALRELTERLAVATPLERTELAGVDQSRADTLHVGGVLLCTLLELAEANEITLCDVALREGLVLDYLERRSATVRAYDVVTDIRRHSVEELARRCGQSGPHPERVARLALELFDQTRDLHQLHDSDRKLLEYAAWLHDVGQHIDYEKHELHAAYIIRNAELRGFTEEEREVVALLARYHRKSRPRSKDVEVAALSGERRHAVEVMAGILRLADGLDRSHHQVVERLHVERERGVLRVHVHTSGDDAELELWGAKRKSKLLARALDREVVLDLVPAPPVAAARAIA